MFDVVGQGRRLGNLLWIIIVGIVLAACQPTPDERYERAGRYFEDAEYRGAVIELKNAIRGDSEFAEARLMLARASYQLADYGTAESEFVRSLELGLDRPDVWAGYGAVLVDTGRSAEALEKVVPHLEQFENNADAQIVLGNIYSALGNFDQANIHYDLALLHEPAVAEALVGKATAAMLANRLPEAESYLADALQANENLTLVWLAKGNLSRVRRQLDSAAEAYQSAIDTEVPETPYATRFLTRSNRTSVLLDSRQFTAAADQLADLETIFPRHPLFNYFRGRVAFGMGQFDLAQTELQEYLSNVPNDLRGQAVLGAVNYSQNYLRQAELYLQRAATANVGGDVTRRLLAETQLRLNKPESALESLRLIDQGGTTNPEVLAMMGRAEIGLGNMDSAVRYFEQGVEADPDNPATFLALSTGLIAAGDYDKAISVLEAMPQAQSGGFKRDTLLIAAYLKSNEQDRAIAESERMIRENPDDTKVFAIAGLLQQTIGNADLAKQRYEQAIELDSGNLSALYGLTRLAIVSGDDAAAETWIARMLELSPAFMPGLAEAAKFYPTIGKQDELQRRLQAAIASQPKSLAPRLLSSRVAIVEGRHADALAIAQSALKDYPDDPRLMHVEGLALAGMGQIESGLISVSNAAKMDPDNAMVVYDLARLSMSVDDFAGAAEAAQQYLALRPDNLAGLAILSESLAKTDRQEEARELLREYRTSHPEQALPLLLSGDLEMLDAEPRAALAYYESAAAIHLSRPVVSRLTQAWRAVDPVQATEPLEAWLEQNPDDTAMRRLYAQVLEDQGNSAAAVKQYEAVLERHEDDAIALNNLAWQYADQGRAGAVELAEKAHRLQPENGSITDTLGWILYLDGNQERALEKLRMAATQSPTNPEIKYHLATLLAETGQNNEAKLILNNLIDENPSFKSRDRALELAKSL